MKKHAFTLLLAVMLVPFGAVAQGSPGPNAERVPPAPIEAVDPARAEKFNLDFEGGTPQELIDAIRASSGKHVNAIIPNEFADLKLPPVKMRDVNTADLFKAMYLASQKRVEMPGYPPRNTSYGFLRDKQDMAGVWYFQAQGLDSLSGTMEPVCSFYQLGPLLSKYKVEDIITAIQTGWQMQGMDNAPSMKFHKETALLIVMGTSKYHQSVQDVLTALQSVTPASEKPREVPAK